jgi:hypothetical protein
LDLIECDLEERAQWSGCVMLRFDLQNRDDNELWSDNETKKCV